MADRYGNLPKTPYGNTNDTGLNQIQALAEIATALGTGRPSGGVAGADAPSMRPPRSTAWGGSPGQGEVATGDYGPMSEGPLQPSESSPVDSSIGMAITALEKGGPYVIGEDPARDEAARMLLDRMGIEYRSIADGMNQVEALIFGRPVDSFSEGSEVGPEIIQRLAGGW